MYVLATAACGPARIPPTAAPPPEPAAPAVAMTLIRAQPEDVGLSPRLEERLDSLLAGAVAEGVAPAAVAAVGRHGRLVYLKGFGTTHSAPGYPGVDSTTIFDMASLTKVVATTTAAMMLEEEGRLDLERTVASYLPQFSDSAKAGITLRMLLTHSGGLEAFARLFETLRGREQYLDAINSRPLEYPPGSATVYSDWDMILLQLVIERIVGDSLDRFVAERIFQPLGMNDTMFRPSAFLVDRIAATEVDPQRGGLLHGVVHDPNAWAMGGIAGHAGLFSSAPDLAIFAQMMLNGGWYDGVRILRPETIARWTARQGPYASRALGWDTPSGESSSGRHFSARAFGHTGFTGTSMWLDPERGLFVILLTNRVNPTADNQKHVPLRRSVADAVQRAVVDAPLVDWETGR
jgi:CubicO group peptidase (beta-lactamase class C family)